MLDALQSHLDFLIAHLVATVFVAATIEATGIPFPSRIILLVAATLAPGQRELAALVAVATVGSLIGDHVPYVAGRLAGPGLLVLYCRLTLGSEQCVEKTIAYFQRFGPAAILLGRFSTSVRLFASAMSGCGHLSYGRFVLYDLSGSLVYATLWVTVGHLLGARAGALLRQHGRVLILVVPIALAGVLAYRLWRRSRYGAARPIALRVSGCPPSVVKLSKNCRAVDHQ